MTRTLSEIDRDIAQAYDRLSDLFGERADAQLPSPEPQAVIELFADEAPFTPDAPSQVLMVRIAQPAPTQIQAALAMTGFSPEGARIAVVLALPGPVIEAGQLFASTKATVTEFPAAGESATFDVAITGAQGAIVGVNSTVTFRVEGPPLPPPPDPVPPRIGRVNLFLWPKDATERILAAPDILASVVEAADSDATTDLRVADRCLCAAALWKMGTAPTGKIYFARAVQALLTLCQKPLPLAGSHYDYTHCHPVALAYDWLRDMLTPEEKTIVRGRIVEALEATIYGKRAQDRNWNGYNMDAGAGMTLALAIDGETEVDYVGIYLRQWWAGAPDESGLGGLYNREYEKNWQEGGGSREGWSYLSDQAALVFTRGVYETATGDTESLAYPWFERMPHLLLHQSQQGRQYDPTGKLIGYRPFSMPAYSYGGEYWGQAGFAYILAAGTGSRDPQTAAISAWLLTRWKYTKSTACEELIFRCLIGDPRVKPQSPEELALPLDYTTEGTGLHYDRSDWSDDATRVFFGAGESPVRNFPRGDVMVWSKGLPLIAARTSQYAHHNAGDERMNAVKLRWADGAVVPRIRGSSTPDRRKLGSFRQSMGRLFIADMHGFYNPAFVQRMRRCWDRNGNVITVLDDIQCADGITPLIIWNTPLNPTVDGTVTFTNGRATARMTFDRAPAEIVVRGGETDQLWAQVYDGSLLSPETTDKLWLNASREQKILEGGFYAVYVTPPSYGGGVFRLMTTIEVRPL